VAGDRASQSLGKPKSADADAYLLTYEMAGLVEAFHRALGQHMRVTGQTRPGAPLSPLRPRNEAVPGLRPDARGMRGIPGTRDAKPAAREEHPE